MATLVEQPWYTSMPKAADVGKSQVPMWEENEQLRKELAEAKATIARLHESVSQMRRERKHLG